MFFRPQHKIRAEKDQSRHARRETLTLLRSARDLRPQRPIITSDFLSPGRSTRISGTVLFAELRGRLIVFHRLIISGRHLIVGTARKKSENRQGDA